MAEKIEFGEAQDWRNPNNPSGTIYTWRFLTKNPITPYINNKNYYNLKTNGETWFVRLRRLDYWFDHPGAASMSSDVRRANKMRGWILCICRRKSKQILLHTDNGEADVDPNPFVYQDKRMKAETVQALIHIYAQNTRKRPKKIIIMASGSSFRATSAERLVSELQAIMPKDAIQSMGNNLEIPHSAESSVIGMYPPQDQAVQEVVEDLRMLMQCIGENMLNHADDKALPQKSEHFISSRGAALFQIRPQMSVALLWSLYHAAKEYHESRPWRTFSNSELLKITLPDYGGTVAIVMVAGYTDYAGRGAYIFDNLRDVTMCQTSKKAMNTYVHRRDCLQFVNKLMFPFHSHDSVVELDLPLASNDLNQEVFPNFHHVHGTFSVGDPNSNNFMDNMMKRWNNKPTIRRMEEIVQLLRAVTHFGNDPTLAYRAEGFSGLHFNPHPVEISVGAPNPFRCVVEVVLQQAGKMSIDEKNETMSLHDKNKCNFCNIPRSPEQKLLGCSRCQYVYYCGSRCQTSDYRRHKKECKEMKRKRDKKKQKKKKKKEVEKVVTKKETEKVVAKNTIDTTTGTGSSNSTKVKKVKKVVRVRLINLKAADMNGKTGVRGKYLEDKERYVVTLDNGTNVRVKPANLEILDVPISSGDER